MACSSNPDTSDWIAVLPEPWLTPPPLSGSEYVWIAPEGMSTFAGWVIVEAGRGAEYTGTRSCGMPPPSGENRTRPLASATNSRGSPLCVAATVGSFVFVSSVGSMVRVSVTVFVEPAETVTLLGETEYVAPGTVVLATYEVSYVASVPP